MILALEPPTAPAQAMAAPTAVEAAKIESRYVPPRWGSQTAGPIDAFLRVYWRDSADPDVIAGQYVAHRPPGVRLLASARNPFPVADGGCGVVNIRYRVSSDSLVARCGQR